MRLLVVGCVSNARTRSVRDIMIIGMISQERESRANASLSYDSISGFLGV